MFLHPSRFRRFPLATRQSHNCPKAKTGLVTRPWCHSADGGVRRYPVELLQDDGTGQGHGVMFTTRGFRHLINNTVRDRRRRNSGSGGVCLVTRTPGRTRTPRELGPSAGHLPGV